MTTQEEINARIARDAAQPESYLTKKKPTIDDWIEYNQLLFDAHRNNELISDSHPYARLTDLDMHAEHLGVPMRELFQHIQSRVGSLGNMALHLVQTEMDDAWHVIIGPAPLES